MGVGRVGGAREGCRLLHQHLLACSMAQHELPHAQQPQKVGVLAWPCTFQVRPSSKGAHARVLCMQSMRNMGGVRLHGKRNSMQLGPSYHACNSACMVAAVFLNSAKQGAILVSSQVLVAWQLIVMPRKAYSKVCQGAAYWHACGTDARV